jgi:acetyltransferase-like isoleucine patch superfamily enzyme
MSDAAALWFAERNGARVYSGTRLGSGCVVHPFAIVGFQPFRSPSLARETAGQPPAVIGEGTVIGPHAVVYAGAVIGRNCVIGDHASIREGTVIGDECVIGQGVSVHYDVQMGNKVRVITGSYITGGCVIGDETFIGAQVVTCNDKRRDIIDYEFVGADAPVIGKRCLIGSGACILAGVTISDGAIVGAGALVVRDVAPGDRVLGTPAGRVATDSERQLAMLRSGGVESEKLEMAYRMGRA